MALPCELIDEILCHLRVKDLLRYRCVSKGWCSLIDTTAFVKKHLKTSLQCNADGGVIIGGGGKIYLTDLECLDGDGDAEALELNDPLTYGVEFIGAANGLVCLLKDEVHQILFYNPSTRKVRKIPTVPPEFSSAFHSTFTSLCGFGYDLVNDDFKVVKIAETLFRGPMGIVYSMKTNSWAAIQDISRNIFFSEQEGTFVSGTLYWLATKVSVTFPGAEIIVGFDLGVEQFREFPFPAVDGTSDNSNSKILFNVGGSLCILDNYLSHMDLYLMNSCGAGNSWQKAFSVEQPGVLGNFLFFRPITFSNSGNVVLLEVDGANLVWYDIEKKAVKRNVKIHGIPSEFYSHLYTESLLLLTKDKHMQKLSPKPSLVKKDKNQQRKRGDFLYKGFNLRL